METACRTGPKDFGERAGETLVERTPPNSHRRRNPDSRTARQHARRKGRHDAAGELVRCGRCFVHTIPNADFENRIEGHGLRYLLIVRRFRNPQGAANLAAQCPECPKIQGIRRSKSRETASLTPQSSPSPAFRRRRAGALRSRGRRSRERVCARDRRGIS